MQNSTCNIRHQVVVYDYADSDGDSIDNAILKAVFYGNQRHSNDHDGLLANKLKQGT